MYKLQHLKHTFFLSYLQAQLATKSNIHTINGLNVSFWTENINIFLILVNVDVMALCCQIIITYTTNRVQFTNGAIYFRGYLKKLEYGSGVLRSKQLLKLFLIYAVLTQLAHYQDL